MNDLILTNSTQIKRNPEIVFSEIDNEVVMLGIDQGSYFGMNMIGSIIWQLLETPKTLGQLFNHMQKDFDVTESQFYNDVAEFLQALKDKDLIEISG